MPEMVLYTTAGGMHFGTLLDWQNIPGTWTSVVGELYAEVVVVNVTLQL